MPPKIDFLKETRHGFYVGGVYYPPPRPKKWKKILFSFVFLLALGFSLFSWQVFSAYQTEKTNQPQETTNTIFSPQKIISHINEGIKSLLAFSGLKKEETLSLKGADKDRINILLLGIGGQNHPGGNLSDTIILLSIQPSTKKVALLSVPRDLYVPISGYGWRKINEAYALGKRKGRGGELASQTIGKIFNLPVHYYLTVDFTGFKKIIDDLGGVKIYVDRSFTDNQYPDNNFGYEPISFQKGWQILNGDRALKYVRSRHGTNGENSDFARSRRQQKVLAALKEKLTSFHFWLNPSKIGQILADLDNHIKTNLTTSEIIKLASFIKQTNTQNIKHIVLTDGPQGELYSTNISGAYALLPKNNDFTTLKIIAKYAFQEEKIAGLVTKPSADHNNQKATYIEVLNGTTIPKLASKTARLLKGDGFKISKIGNAYPQTYQNTIIYSFSKDKKSELYFLKNKLRAITASKIPNWLIGEKLSSPSSPLPDFVIILGKDQDIGS